VAVPRTPNGPALHGLDAELRNINSAIPTADMSLVGDDATVGNVAGVLQRAGSIHLACHGSPELPDGTAARLYLSDGSLSLNRVSWLEFRAARLAYLSACHTADTSLVAFDEVNHLCAAFQDAGFRNVVGTLWAANDRAAASVAGAFYSNLSAFGWDHSAEALHHAVRALRDQFPDRPFLWAPFVHFGP
jgi:CHAT domain-containing protein